MQECTRISIGVSPLRPDGAPTPVTGEVQLASTGQCECMHAHICVPYITLSRATIPTAAKIPVYGLLTMSHRHTTFLLAPFAPHACMHASLSSCILYLLPVCTERLGSGYHALG